MRLLSSNFSPLKVTESNFFSRWEQLFASSSEIRIAVGYASNDSILHLKKLLELNVPKKLELCLGMAYFDGMSRSQLEALDALNYQLTEDNLGELRVVRTFPFHGKIYEFVSQSKECSYILGSSNLSNVVPIKGIGNRHYEVDIEISEQQIGIQLNAMLDSLFQDCSVPFDGLRNQIRIYENPNPLLDGRMDVEKVGMEDLLEKQAHRMNNTFEIPLKDAPKSNLNVFFGEGRVDKQGFTKPRHWYEVEIIVDQVVQRSAHNYPVNVDFVVYTDDGYKFLMKTSGDYGKNLRSKDDLTILGRWIKGRMEISGALSSGEIVKSSNLEKYGRSSISFIETSLQELDLESGKKLSVWLMDFRAPELVE